MIHTCTKQDIFINNYFVIEQLKSIVHTCTSMPNFLFSVLSIVKELEMREWMVVIDAVVQGAPEDAPRRRQTVNSYYATKYKDKVRITAKPCDNNV